MNTAPMFGRLAAACAAAVLLSSCGGGDSDVARDAATARERPLALPSGTVIPADANTKGFFAPPQNWPLIAVHGVMTSDGRILSYGTKGDGTQTGVFIYDVWDPTDDSHTTFANGTGTDIFCSSQILLPDGAGIAISGGDNWTGTGTTNTGNDNATVFDVASGSLTRGSNMNRQRWYSSSTMLLNGEVYVQGGTGGTDRPEIRGVDGSYRLLSGANTSGFNYMYPRNFVAPDGRLFGFDSAGKMYYVDPSGAGAVTQVGQFANAVAGSDSSAAMFAPGRILQYGGNSNQALVIDINGAAPTVTSTAAMLRQRRLSTATLLPDGKVLATGGSSVWNVMTNVSYEAEIWNPQTGQWTVGASAIKPRLYHGNALLLADATVLVFGGGAPSPSGVPGNLNAEIYYPPYLFSTGGSFAARPQIDSAPTVVDTGRTVQVGVTSGNGVSRVTFVKTGSATHGWNMDQRFVDLPFNRQDNLLSVQIPARASDVPPGTWMMFVIDDAGVPSAAKLVRVNVAASMNVATQPVITSPASQNTAAGSSVALQIGASDPNGDTLRFSASGLPEGLSIDTATGLVSGSPTTIGSYSVLFAASDGLNSSSVTITWNVTAAQPLVLDPPSMAAPTVVGNDANFSASATGLNVQYRWDFGDGTLSEWSTQGTAQHAYTSPGVYYVSVTAADAQGVEQHQTIIHNVQLQLTAHAPTMSSALLLEPRSGASSRLWVLNPDNDSVTVFDAVTRAKLAEVAVGIAPRSLALAADGTVWVTNKRSASISIISPASLAVTRTIALPRASQPYGLAMARGNGSALVALEATGQLLKINTTSFATTASLSVGPNPRHVAVAADGSTAWVSRFITPPLPGEATATVLTQAQGQAVGGEVVVVNSSSMSVHKTVVLAHSDRPDSESSGRGIPNYLGAAAISPDGSQAYVPSKQDNILRGGARDQFLLNFQNTVRAISSRIDMATQREDLDARIDHDNASLASAAAYDPLGVYLFVALETSREVVVLDAHHRNELMRIDVGRAPQGLVVSPDRRTLYVHHFMDRTVGVFDLSPLIQQGLASATPLATLPTVTTEKLAATVLRGKQFFYDARDPRLALDRYMSCATCHNDGGHDGRVWDLTSQGEGLRNTINLRGRGGAQGQLHWSNNFDEVQDFEGQIRTLAGGRGLMSDSQFHAGTRSTPLGDAKAGLSSDLDALAAYVASLDTPDPSPHRAADGSLSALGTEGKALFASLDCGSCHTGSTFTRSAVNNPANIGSIKPTSGKRLNGPLNGIDVPTLRDVWATAPYLHDGSAAGLDAAVRAHGGVSVSDADMTRLVAYLREIGSEEPFAPVAGSGGLAGRYFNNLTLSGNAALSRTEAVDFNWGSGSPGGGVNADNFSARWSGRLVAPASGSYVFQTESDDGVRVWIGGVLVINNWTDHAPTLNTTAAITLSAGQQVEVIAEYYEKTGGASMRLRWQPPGATAFTAIPASLLIPVAVAPAPQGLAASYFNNTTLGGTAVLTRNEAVDFNWGTAAPGGGVTADNFSVRWTGSVTVPTTGSYRLRTVSDDGVRLWVNGSRVINNWTNHSSTTNTSGTISLVAGQRVPITLEYYERTGSAVIRLQWLKAGTSSYVAIPASSLNPN